MVSIIDLQPVLDLSSSGKMQLEINSGLQQDGIGLVLSHDSKK
jgi:hypothetical protein